MGVGAGEHVLRKISFHLNDLTLELEFDLESAM